MQSGWKSGQGLGQVSREGITSIAKGCLTKFRDQWNDLWLALSIEIAAVGDFVFERCETLMNIEVPGRVESDLADCARMTGVVLPDGVRSVADAALQDVGEHDGPVQRVEYRRGYIWWREVCFVMRVVHRVARGVLVVG